MSNQEINPNRAATRAPVERPIRLQFDDSMEAVEGICENLSIGGMFIRVRETRPQGSLVRFELPMEEGRSIRGLAEVVWMRTTKAGPGRDPGVGIKFRFLEQRDRQLIFKVVSEHIKERLAKRPSLLEEESPAPKVDEGMIFRPPEDEAAPPPSPQTPSGVRRWPAPPVPEPSAPAAVEEEPPATIEPQPWQPEPTPATPIGYEHAAEWEPPEPEDSYESPPPRRRPPLAALIALVVLTLAATVLFLWPDLLGGGGDEEEAPPIVTEDPGAPALPPPATPEAAGAEESPVEAEGGATTEAPPVTPPPPAPEPAPPPPPPPPPPPAVSAEKAFDRLEDIAARRVGDATEIVLTTNGSVPDGRYRSSRIGGDNPRELLRLLGMGRPFRATEVPVEAPLVRRIRVGYHKKSAGNEVHVVIDLEGPGVEVTEIRAEGRSLVVRLAER